MNSDIDIIYSPKAIGNFPMLSEMWVEPGTQADWDILKDLHYKLHSLPVGASYYRLRYRDETIGVCVFGMSRPLLKERHVVFPLLKPGIDTQISNIHRYAYINDNFRVVARFVIDTMFRSSGVAYRFLNLAARMRGFTYAEIQSSMGKYNFFAQRGGFSMVKPIRSLNYDKGLKFMRRWFDAHPADQEALMDEFKAMSPAMQTKVEEALKTFYFDSSPLEKTGSRRHYAHGVVQSWDVRRTITKIQGLCFASPLYGFYRNPDASATLPTMLPLKAFDLQGVDEPLRLDLVSDLAGWRDLQSEIVTRKWLQPANVSSGSEHKRKHESESVNELIPSPSKTDNGKHRKPKKSPEEGAHL